MGDLVTKASATISPCGRYRYRLSRRWVEGPSCVFVMLNPSTADHREDDPTIRRCIRFAKREGCGALEVVNLMAFRATKPSDLPRTMIERAGPENSRHVQGAIEEADGPIVFAWGANKLGRMHAGDVVRIVADTGRQAYALHINSDGSYKHPLYVAADAPLIPLFAQAMEQ